MSPVQTMRADARKNHEALISVARRHLSSQGVSTSLEAIAREAGVGVGTLYRHFPDRDHLIFAALNAQGEELRAASDRLRTTAADGDRLESWLHQVQHYLGSYQGLPDSVAQALDYGDDSPLAITCQEIIEITEEFLADAQRDGTVRAEVTGQALFHATLMLAWLGSQLPADQLTLGDVHEILRHGYRTRIRKP
jgi:AcrR family transcriptional regulator